MKNKLTKEERRAAYAALSSKEKIQMDGKKLLKVLDVVRKILHVFAIISCVFGITFAAISVCHKSMEVQEKTGIVQIEGTEHHGNIHLVSILEEDDITLEEDTPAGWDKLFLEIGVYCLVWAVGIVIFMLITRFVKKIFSQVMNDETPFSEGSKAPLRKVFILMTIVIFCKGKLMGIVCGFVFLYLYRLFAYGCELQVESDETL